MTDRDAAATSFPTPDRKRVFLHVGHGKTGSSAIQSMLARNAALLSAQGFLYPEHASSETARAGQVMSGNLDSENWFEGQVMPIVRGDAGHHSILFSNENLFRQMDDFLARHGDYRATCDFELLLFVRDPVEMLASSYQQAVKRGGFFGSLADFAEHETSLRHVAELVDTLVARDIRFALFNYSAMKTDAVRRFFAHLGLWDSVGGGPDAVAGTVNRSLGAAELDFLRYVNRIFGPGHGRLLSDALVNRLPDIPADSPPIDAATRADMRARNADAVAILNPHLPEGERIDLDATDGDADTPAPNAGLLSTEQVEVIRRAFPATLVPADGVVLRDIALSHDRGAPLDREQAIALMEYAQKARPQGQIIAGKLAEWRQAADPTPATPAPSESAPAPTAAWRRLLGR